jgi:hypothetical protein
VYFNVYATGVTSVSSALPIYEIAGDLTLPSLQFNILSLASISFLPRWIKRMIYKIMFPTSSANNITNDFKSTLRNEKTKQTDFGTKMLRAALTDHKLLK